MKIKIYTDNKREIKHFVEFISTELIIFHKNITVYIKKGELDCEAQVQRLRHRKGYVITLFNQIKSIRKILNNISHELIHIYQYETKKLEYNHNNKYWYWENKPYNYNSDYSKVPWEIEAIGLGYWLYKKYKIQK